MATARISLINVALNETTLKSQFDAGTLDLTVPFGNSSAWADGKIEPGTQTIDVFNGSSHRILSREMQLDNGADYTLILANDGDAASLQTYTAIKGGSVSILWQLPQYAVLTAGASQLPPSDHMLTVSPVFQELYPEYLALSSV